MPKHVLMPLLLLCLVATGGCSFDTPFHSAAAKPSPTLAPTNTLAASGPGAYCPQLPLAKPGAAPTAPASVYVSILPSVAEASSPTAPSWLAALNPKDGSARWKEVMSRNWHIGVGNVVVASNVVYAAINMVGPQITGVLVALNAKDGALRWCVPLLSPDDPTPSSGSWHVFAADQQTVYVAKTTGGPLLALKTSDGSLRWSGPYGQAYYALVGGNGLVYVMLQIGTLVTVIAENASDGNGVWFFQPQHWVGGGLALDNGALYFAESGPTGSAGYLDKVNSGDGTLLEQSTVTAGAGGTGLSVEAVADGSIYTSVSTQQENPWGIMAFDVNGEKKTWELHQDFETGPVVADGMLYLCSMQYPQSTVSALDAKTGASLWNQVLPDQVPAAQIKPASTIGQDFRGPLVLNGLVYVSYEADEGGTLAPVLAALEGKTGALQWRLANEIPLAAA